MSNELIQGLILQDKIDELQKLHQNSDFQEGLILSYQSPNCILHHLNLGAQITSSFLFNYIINGNKRDIINAVIKIGTHETIFQEVIKTFLHNDKFIFMKQYLQCGFPFSINDYLHDIKSVHMFETVCDSNISVNSFIFLLQNKRFEESKIAIQRGFDIDKHELLCHFCKSKGNEDIITFLLQNGANKNIRNCRALTISYHKGYYSYIQILNEY